VTASPGGHTSSVTSCGNVASEEGLKGFDPVPLGQPFGASGDSKAALVSLRHSGNKNALTGGAEIPGAE
jgi:hypothetical protein